MNHTYALAGYGYDTETPVTTFPEERRQWRVKIENHVTDEAEQTRDLVDERADKIDEEVNEVNTYLVETIEPHINTVEEKVDDVKNYLQNTVVNTYLVPIKDKVTDIKATVEQTNSYVRGTLTSYVDQVEGYTDTLEGTQSEQNTLLQNIWNKVRYLPTSW